MKQRSLPYQSVCAYMLSKNEQCFSKHTHVRAYVGRELGLPGLVPMHLVKVYNRLMNMRSDADYNPTVEFTREEVTILVSDIQQFNEVVKNLI
jgi:uncharacterized protein (UPF0332 family)